MPSINTKLPTPLAEKQPQNLTFPPPNLTVVCTFFGLSSVFFWRHTIWRPSEPKMFFCFHRWKLLRSKTISACQHDFWRTLNASSCSLAICTVFFLLCDHYNLSIWAPGEQCLSISAFELFWTPLLSILARLFWDFLWFFSQYIVHRERSTPFSGHVRPHFSRFRGFCTCW